MTPERFRRHFLDVVEAGEFVCCRYHGLVGAEGCEHLVTGFEPPRPMARANSGPAGFSNPPAAFTATSVRINPATGLPLSRFNQQ